LENKTFRLHGKNDVGKDHTPLPTPFFPINHQLPSEDQNNKSGQFCPKKGRLSQAFVTRVTGSLV
jgi:hypothetical protein